jgi:hypothetical protein
MGKAEALPVSCVKPLNSLPDRKAREGADEVIDLPKDRAASAIIGISFQPQIIDDLGWVEGQAYLAIADYNVVEDVVW